MKNILKLLLLLSLIVMGLWSCEKDENKDYFEGGTLPVLTSSEGAAVEYANADKVALILNWTNPNYTFTTGASSLDVTYKIEIDTAESDFSNPLKKIITVNKDLSYSFLVSELNDIMLNQLNLEDSIPHTLEFRVTSSLTNNSVPLTSNTVQLTVIPYQIPPKVQPPPSGHLYIIGSALTGNDDGWNNPVASQYEFTKVDETNYTITVSLYGGYEYLFIPVNGDWSHKYAVQDNTITDWKGGDFLPDASDNFPGPPESGTYKVDVDFQKGKFTVTKQ